MLGDEVLTMDRKQQPRANTYVHVVRYDAIQVRFDLLCDREGRISCQAGHSVPGLKRLAEAAF
jgi:hypothetical protein